MDDETVGFVEAAYDTELSGVSVVGEGDLNGSAVAQLTITRDKDAVCYNVWNVQNIGAATGTHIHYGRYGQNGLVEATLERGEGGGWNGCIEGAGLASKMLSTGPELYYVQIHTSEYPEGAIRGQFRAD
ncbi:CHRD domain-containing protein [Erythrobacteraceae bacterium WH01K]|nr:CHRD domain-containing protein [Erythrobacteraceae bacterium WH01K]